MSYVVSCRPGYVGQNVPKDDGRCSRHCTPSAARVSKLCQHAMQRDGTFIRFVRPLPFIPFSVLLERSAVAVGTVKKGGGDTLICQWAGGRGVEGEHRALQLQQHRRRRRPICPSHRDNDENVLHRPIHTNAEIQFLKEPRAGGHLVLLGYDSPIQLVLLRTSFANGVCVLWQGPAAGHS